LSTNYFKKFQPWQLTVQPLRPSTVDFKNIGPDAENVEISHGYGPEYDLHDWLYQRQVAGPKQRQNHHGALDTRTYCSTTELPNYKPTSVFNTAGQERVITEVAVLIGTEMIDFERVEDWAFWEYREKTR
jgi:hypothetical protein